jgi:hypothetical protein
MDELNNLKAIIDKELSALSVTNKLQKKVMKSISTKNFDFLWYIKHNWMRMTTIFSLLVIMFMIGINSVNKENNITGDKAVLPPQNKIFNDNSYLERFTVSDDLGEVEEENPEVKE